MHKFVQVDVEGYLDEVPLNLLGVDAASSFDRALP